MTAGGCIEKSQTDAVTVIADKPAAALPVRASLRKEKPKPQDPPAAKKANTSAIVTVKESNSCPTICQRSKDLGCSIGPEDCITACEEMQDVPVCKAEMQEVVGCMITKPAKDWECSEEGIAAIRDGVCDDEQRRFMTCITAANP